MCDTIQSVEVTMGHFLKELGRHCAPIPATFHWVGGGVQC